MIKKFWSRLAVVNGLLLLAICAAPSPARAQQVEQKSPMYSYISNWQIPRAHWAEMASANAADKATLDKALADGTIVGYGDDENMVHTPDGATHDNWWSSTSMAGLMKVLNTFMTNGSATSPVIQTTTKHWDNVLVSRYYNWQSGPYQNAYVRVASYQLRASAPDDAVDNLSRNLVAPLLEKMLASGAIREYEIDTEAIHTDDPNTFWIVYVCPAPEGLDTVNAAITDAMKASPLSGPAFGSMVDYSGHRDELQLGEGTYK